MADITRLDMDALAAAQALEMTPPSAMTATTSALARGSHCIHQSVWLVISTGNDGAPIQYAWPTALTRPSLAMRYPLRYIPARGNGLSLAAASQNGR
jgi:hypothetical protein